MMGFNRLILIVFFCGQAGVGVAQLDANVAPAAPFDSLYITSYADKLAVKLYGVSKSNQISHVDDFTGDRISYKPNDKFNIGAGFSYEWLSLDLAFNLLGINNDDDQFGETKRLDLQANIYLRKFAFDLNMQFYEGYYVSNPQVFLPDWTDDLPYPQRPDMQTTSIGASGLYIFKHNKFSYRSTFIFNERQKKSAGSWLAGGFINYFTFDADSSIVPMELEGIWNPDIDFRNTNFIRFGAAGGYAHTFVIGKKFFFSLTLALGLGPELRTSRDDNTNEKMRETIFATSIGARTALGFNSDKTFFGLTTVASTASGAEDNNALLEHSINNLRVFIGRRFDVSKSKLFRKISAL